MRLPISVSHSESVNLQFEKPFTLKKVRDALNSFDGCKVIDERIDGGYLTPLEAEGNVSNLKELIIQNYESKNKNLLYVSGELVSFDLDKELLKEGFSVKRLINYKKNY